jgi:hypothetical protein
MEKKVAYYSLKSIKKLIHDKNYRITGHKASNIARGDYHII